MGLGHHQHRGVTDTDTAITSQYGYVEYLYHILPVVTLYVYTCSHYINVTLYYTYVTL